MEQVTHQLPCDGDGTCMQCKKTPCEEEKLLCKTCVTPWHVTCLACPPETLASTLQWECPDCTCDLPPSSSSAAVSKGGIVADILAIEADKSLSESEKARRKQELMSGKSESESVGNDVLDVLSGKLNCSFCMELPERPVSTPCGHNFCLKCFQKWIAMGKRTCAKCRTSIPSKMASQPRINSSLVVAIRMAKMSKTTVAGGPSKVSQFVHNKDRPLKAYTTERAKYKGMANAASGKIFVTVPTDHFGPILAEHDPERNQGVLVGETWDHRMECRQWGMHFPPVAGIAGQADHGAQSVVLSGGYVDDEDHGEWFLYTGSGGRDLTGNKRTNKNQSFDQKFEKFNEALRVSCKKGYPVRVLRSHKEKRSAYAPEKGLRYDGVYRIEECWRKVGLQGFKVCRYLFVRCDNDPAPWTSDEHGDRPRPLPEIPELKNAFDITKRKEGASWDYDEGDGYWKWIKPPPVSKMLTKTGNSYSKKRSRGAKSQAHGISVKEKLLKEFSCLICKQVLTDAVTTPCGHNFCKSCLEEAFSGKSFLRERNTGGRALRSQKNVMKCPFCTNDISDFLKDPQVNRELMGVIESLKEKTEETAEGSNGEEMDVEEGINGEEMDGEEGVNDLVSEENCEESTVYDDGSRSPQMERTHKRNKIDLDDVQIINNVDEVEKYVSSEKSDVLDGAETGKLEVENMDVKAKEAVEERNDSSSIPQLTASAG